MRHWSERQWRRGLPPRLRCGPGSQPPSFGAAWEAPPNSDLYTGNSVVNLISSIDNKAVTLKILTSEISAW